MTIPPAGPVWRPSSRRPKHRPGKSFKPAPQVVENTQVPRKAMDALQRHPWPGNVRELRNVIEHAAILTTGDTLRIPALDDAAPAGAPQPTLADSERQLILRALETTGWRIKGPKGTAAALGLNPSTLYSRMEKLGIRPPGQAEDGPA